MILFRPVLGIYAIGDLDKPRMREREREKRENEVAPMRRESERPASRLGAHRERMRETEREQEREKRERRIILFLHQSTRATRVAAYLL